LQGFGDLDLCSDLDRFRLLTGSGSAWRSSGGLRRDRGCLRSLEDDEAAALQGFDFEGQLGIF
jgi:hypothetical protein